MQQPVLMVQQLFIAIPTVHCVCVHPVLKLKANLIYWFLADPKRSVDCSRHALFLFHIITAIIVHIVISQGKN